MIGIQNLEETFTSPQFNAAARRALLNRLRHAPQGILRYQDSDPAQAEAKLEYLDDFYAMAFNRVVAGLTREKMGLKQEQTTLDIGCGTVPDFIELAGDKKHSGTILAVDKDRLYLDELQKRLVATGIQDAPQFQIIETDATDLSAIEANSVDQARMIRVYQYLHHDNATPRALAEIARVLKPGRPLVIAEEIYRKTQVVLDEGVDLGFDCNSFLWNIFTRGNGKTSVVNSDVDETIEPDLTEAGFVSDSVVIYTTYSHSPDDMDHLFGCQARMGDIVEKGLYTAEECQNYHDRIVEALYARKARMMRPFIVYTATAPILQIEN